VDLGNLESVFKAVERIRWLTKSIDIFFANAGVSGPPKPLSTDGLESVFAINHVGHYALITRLLPIILRTALNPEADVRIVIVSSVMSYYAKGINFNELDKPYVSGQEDPGKVYVRSKFSNFLFGMKLAQHVRERGFERVYVNMSDPGIIFGTGIHLQTESSHTLFVRIFIVILNWLVGFSIPDGALTTLFLGTSPLVKKGNVNGEFCKPFGNLVPKDKLPKAASMALADKLWEWTEDFVSRRETELKVTAADS
jgi:NAD(P)-dependent dehydrogenase (short-subunit alcohol dehydrogenase family)